MVGAEQPPSPELRREGVAEYEDGEAPAGGGSADPQQPGRSLRPAAGPLRRLGEPRTRRGAEARGVARGGVARVPAGVPGSRRVCPGRRVGLGAEKALAREAGLSSGESGERDRGGGPEWAPRWAEPECGCVGWAI